MVKVGKGVLPLLEGRFLALLWVFQSPTTAPPPASSSSEVHDRDARRFPLVLVLVFVFVVLVIMKVVVSTPHSVGYVSHVIELINDGVGCFACLELFLSCVDVPYTRSFYPG
ncbi:hypothetical protein L484_008678 [Morus notabilis]|uniref:Uncharacterized protein n=1 Tax=Morus notabilis TaxID=981085 RepID=W9QZT4_9ROSA|nr:hypothetical protein L484_008678 [Morus notabilis]